MVRIVYEIIVHHTRVEYHVNYEFILQEAINGKWMFRNSQQNLLLRRRLLKNSKADAWVDVSNQEEIETPVGIHNKAIFQYYWYEPMQLAKGSLILSSVLYGQFEMQLTNYKYIEVVTPKITFRSVFIYCSHRYSIACESHEIQKIEDSHMEANLQKYLILRSLFKGQDFDLQYVDLKLSVNPSFQLDSSLVIEKLQQNTSLINVEYVCNFGLQTLQKIVTTGFPSNFQQHVYLLLDMNPYCKDSVRCVVRRALPAILFAVGKLKIPICIECINSSSDRYHPSTVGFALIELSDICKVLQWFDLIQLSQGSLEVSFPSIMNTLQNTKENRFVHLMIFSCESLYLDANCKNYTDFLQKPYEMSLNLYNIIKDSSQIKSITSSERNMSTFSYPDSPKIPFRIQTIPNPQDLIRLAIADIKAYGSSQHYMISNIRIFGKGEPNYRIKDSNWYVMSRNEPLIYSCDYQGELDSCEFDFDLHNIRGEHITSKKLQNSITMKYNLENISLPYIEVRDPQADVCYGQFNTLKDYEATLRDLYRTKEMIEHQYDQLNGSHFIKPLQIGSRKYKPIPLWRIHNDLVQRYVLMAKCIVLDFIADRRAIEEILPNRKDGHRDWLVKLVTETAKTHDIIDYAKTFGGLPEIQNLVQLFTREVSLESSIVSQICDILWMMNRGKILAALFDDSLADKCFNSDCYRELWDEGYPIEKIHAIVDGIRTAICVLMIDKTKDGFVEKVLSAYVAVFNSEAQGAVDPEETIEPFTYFYKLRLNRYQAEMASTEGLSRDYRQSYADYYRHIDTNRNMLIRFSRAKKNKYLEGENEFNYKSLNLS